MRRLVRRGNLARGRDWVATARQYRAALRLDPTLDQIWIQLGHAYSECGAMVDAVSAYASAARLQPERSEPLMLLGEAAKRMRRHHLAARLHLMAMARPDSADGQPQLFANVSVEGERVGVRAMAELGRSITLDPIIEELLDEDRTPVPNTRERLALDVTDLVQHLARFRTLSGIQRVQASVVAAIAATVEPGLWTTWLFAPKRQEFVEIRYDELKRLIDIASGPRRSDDAELENIRSDLFATLSLRAAASPPDGVTVLNLGAPWLLDGYGKVVTGLLGRGRAAFVPFVHDVIPLLFPALVDGRTHARYAAWITRVGGIAAKVLVNSANTKADLIRVSAELAAPIATDRIKIIRLDAHFADRIVKSEPRVAVSRPADSFALMVATFERRKNHPLAFDAWRGLVRKHGADAVPRLICVGRTTEESVGILHDLHALPDVAGLVTVQHEVSDGELQALYDQCLFSVYPSTYEGWGLPVTESLSHGRVPVVAANSSLVEAGGELALYFESGSAEALMLAAERVAFDAGWRIGREREIARMFQPRLWTDVAREILAVCSLDRA